MEATSETSLAAKVLGVAASPFDCDALALGSSRAAAPSAATPPTAMAALRLGIRL